MKCGHLDDYKRIFIFTHQATFFALLLKQFVQGLNTKTFSAIMVVVVEW